MELRFPFLLGRGGGEGGRGGGGGGRGGWGLPDLSDLGGVAFSSEEEEEEESSDEEEEEEEVKPSVGKGHASDSTRIAKLRAHRKALEAKLAALEMEPEQ